MIGIEHLTKSFETHKKPIVALNDLSLTIPSGSVFGLIGSNGAGKSTLLRLLAGVYKPDKGSVLLDGAPIYDNPCAKEQIFFIPDDFYYMQGASLDKMAKLYRSFYLILKLTDMDLASCWLTFTDSEDIKNSLGIESDLDVVAMAAFGHGAKTTRRLRLNIKSMSNVDVVAQHRYMEPKRWIQDMSFVNTWGNPQDLRQQIGFFDDMLWESLYAATLAPSYLNRQAYGFVLHGGSISLISRPDPYNTAIDKDLSLGVVLHHFSSVAENWVGKLRWDFHADGSELNLPEGHLLVATCPL